MVQLRLTDLGIERSLLYHQDGWNCWLKEPKYRVQVIDMKLKEKR